MNLPKTSSERQKKVQQYLNDLNDLNKHYQLQVVPVLDYGNSKIEARIVVADIIPPKKRVLPKKFKKTKKPKKIKKPKKEKK